jgi:ribulose-phosphate 3-epimerase
MFKAIDLLLVMSVEPGFSGQSFHESTYERLGSIQQIQKRLKTNIMIQVDGGVSDKNAKKLIEYGATNLVSGSYIFKHGPSKFIKMVESLR